MTLCQRRPDPAAPASMRVLARTAVHAFSHGGGILVSILHSPPYLQAVLTLRVGRITRMLDSGAARAHHGGGTVSYAQHAGRIIRPRGLCEWP